MKGVIHMATTIKIKPITVTTVINEAKYIKEIKESLDNKPSVTSQQKNIQALLLLRRIRRG